MRTREFSLGWGKGLCFVCRMVWRFTIMALLEAVEVRRPICSARHYYWQSSGPKDKRLYQALKSATRSHAVSCRQSCYVYSKFQIACDFFF